MRRAVTILELLVVVSIIALLAGLGSYAVFRTIPIQKRSNTQASMRKIHSMLQRHRKAVVDDAKSEQVPVSVLAMAGGDPGRARVVWIKLRLKQQFPQTFAAATSPAPGLVSADPTYSRILAARTGTTNPSTESAACLLMSLTSMNRRGVQVSYDSMEVADTDGDGVPELVDAWGHPLAYFPWPTPPAGSANYTMLTAAPPTGLNPTSPSAYAPGITPPFQDAEDPLGTLLDPAWLASPGGIKFQQLCHPVRPGPQGIGQFMTPMVVSAGGNPTGQVWLNPDMSPQPSPSSPNTYNLYVPSP